jgi:hypothetical protein
MMKPVICKHTKETKRGEVTTITVFGVPVFRSVYVGAEVKKIRPCGFTAYASDAPVEDNDDDTEDDDDDEQFIILPYDKEK